MKKGSDSSVVPIAMALAKVATIAISLRMKSSTDTALFILLFWVELFASLISSAGLDFIFISIEGIVTNMNLNSSKDFERIECIDELEWENTGHL